MNFKLSITSGLFPENQFSDMESEKIYPELNCYNKEIIENYFGDITKNIKVDSSIFEWKILFTVYLGGAPSSKEIQIFKRGFTYLNEKEKQISIRIDLPTSDEAKWGIVDKRRYNEHAKRRSDTGFTLIPVDYNKYDNMKDYIEDSIKIALRRALTDGITLKAQKIKIS